MRWIVVDPKLVPHAVLFTDAMESEPSAGRVTDIVVPVVARGPSGHGTLLHPVGETTRLRLSQQRHEVLRELLQVLIHTERLVTPHEPANRFEAKKCRGVEHAKHEVVLLRPDRSVV